MADDVDGSARIRIELDDSGIPAEARALGDRIADAINGQINGIGRSIERQLRTVRIQVQVSPDLSRFEAELLAGLAHLDSINIPVSPDLARFDAQLLAGLRGIDSINIPVAPDLTDFDARLRAHHLPTLNVPVNPDTNAFTRSLRSLLSFAGGVGGALGKALKFGLIGASALSAASNIASLVTALAPAAGILAALPAGILGTEAALGALKLGLLGVSDAFSAALGDDPKKFTQAIADLSPKAQAAAKEVRALKPAFDSLRTSVQDALFAPLAGQITAVAKALDGTLRQGLSNIAAQFGAAGASVANFLKSATAVQSIRQVLSGTTDATRGLATAITPVVSGFLQLGGVIAKTFGGQLGTLIGTIGVRVGDFLQKIATGGQAVAWVRGALTVFQQLGGVLLQLGGLAADVFKALQASGGGQLAGLAAILGAVRTAIQPLLPLLTELSSLANTVLASALKVLVAAITPVLDALAGTLVPLLPQLSTGLAAFASALAPIAAQLGQGIAAALTALLPPVLQLVPVLTGALLPAFSSLVGAVAPLVQLLGVVLAPVITQLGRLLAVVLGGAVKVVMPLLAPLVEFAADLAVRAAAAGPRRHPGRRGAR